MDAKIIECATTMPGALPEGHCWFRGRNPSGACVFGGWTPG